MGLYEENVSWLHLHLEGLYEGVGQWLYEGVGLYEENVSYLHLEGGIVLKGCGHVMFLFYRLASGLYAFMCLEIIWLVPRYVLRVWGWVIGLECG